MAETRNVTSGDRKQIRKFGAIAFLFFGALFALGLWREKILAISLFGTLFALGLGFLILPGPLRPLYNKWLTIAHFIGKCLTAIILILTYYFVITPTAWIKRVFSGRPLPTKPDRDVPSYWVIRQEAAQPKARFIKRY